jgi:hypothetical protein
MGDGADDEDEVALTALSCETGSDYKFGELMFELEGDTDEFFNSVDLSFGDVRIRVPENAVGKHDVIKFDEVTSEQITITYTGNDRRNLVSSSTTGDRYVLVIRVSDDNDNSGDRKVAQNAAHYRSEIFGSDNRNLVSNVSMRHRRVRFQSNPFAYILIIIVMNRNLYSRIAQMDNYISNQQVLQLLIAQIGSQRNSMKSLLME